MPPPPRRSIFTRRRILVAFVAILGLLVAGWLGGRRMIARWAVHKALAAAGLEPATFEVRSAGLGSLQIANLSVGASPWLSAESVDAAYSLADLWSRRVQSIDIRKARWTVDASGEAVQWGFTPKQNAGPPTLAMPFDSLALHDSAIRLITGEGTHEIPISALATPAAPDAIDYRVELRAMDRAMTFTGRAKTAADGLTLELDGRSGYPAPPAAKAPGPDVPSPVAAPSDSQAGLKGTLVRATDGSMQIDATLTLDNLAERVGVREIGLSHATLSARATLDVGGAVREASASISAQNPRVGDVAIRTLELMASKAGASEVRVQAAASADTWQLPAAEGTVRWESRPKVADSPSEMLFTVGMQTKQPIALSWEASGATGLIDSLVANAKVRAGGKGFGVLEGNLTLRGGSLTAGGLALSDMQADAVMTTPDAIDITSFAAIIGDGGTVSAAPFTWTLNTPRIQTRFTMSDLGLAEWLPLITREHATGEGRVSGHADVVLDWSTGAVRVGQLSGSLRADPQHGFIQATDADALGEVLEQQDPRFATDETLRSVRDKIIAALRDFAFSTLTVELSRQGDQTVALTYLSGFGRHGEDPQGLNLTLDLHVQDAFLDLSKRIASQSKITDAAQSALDRFFNEPPTENPP